MNEIQRVCVGNRVFTLAQITHAEFDSEHQRLNVFIAAPEMRAGMEDQALVKLKGPEAISLWNYLTNVDCQTLVLWSEEAS